jgi:hypothetical protein
MQFAYFSAKKQGKNPANTVFSFEKCLSCLHHRKMNDHVFVVYFTQQTSAATWPSLAGSPMSGYRRVNVIE